MYLRVGSMVLLRASVADGRWSLMFLVGIWGLNAVIRGRGGPDGCRFARIRAFLRRRVHMAGPGRCRIRIVMTVNALLTAPHTRRPLARASGLRIPAFPTGSIGSLPFRSSFCQVLMRFLVSLQPRRAVHDARSISRTFEGEGLAVQTSSRTLVTFDLPRENE